MDDKFILMGLGDENSKDIAEIMKSKTAKKIIDFLADRKEASEKEIADNLGMPMNTVEYNLNKLVKTGLVKKSDKIYWSEKGKRIDMYQLARKHIIISPDKKPSLNYLKSILPIFLIVAVAVALVAIGYNNGMFESNGNTPGGVIVGEQGNSNIEGLKSFGSIDELKTFLKENQDEGRNNYGYAKAGDSVTSAAMPSTAQAESSFDNSGGGTAGDYSTTNIQVEGVDEPDIVKNDGKYIYTVVGNKVVIVNAFPANEMNIISEIDLNRSITNIFVNGDRLVIFSQSYNYIEYDTQSGVDALQGVAAKIGIMPPRGYSVSKVQVDVYDISDREDPQLENNYKIDGNYRDARMIDNHVYVISNEYASYDYPVPMYEVNGVAKEMPVSDIYYFDYASSYSFTSVSAIDIENGDFESEVYLLDSYGSIYVSQDNIYLTYQKWIDNSIYTEKLIEEGIMPLLSTEKKEEARAIMESEKSIYEKYDQINKIVRAYSDSLEGEAKSDFDRELRNNIKEIEQKIEQERMKTVVNKIHIDGMDIEYENKGEVPGNVLNQFSMDEHNGYFRIATTTGDVWNGNSYNHLYVLDSELDIVGRVENLAEGERIYSARFMGDRAYLVTFKKIDPLFVIDLSDAENPEVLGYLKVTGYSDYLHFYDENHIIGIGKETAGGGENFAYYQGLKISLFDVSDVANPKEVAKIELGERGTDSSALYDHKAFLFDREKNLLVIPIQIAEINKSQYMKQYKEIPDWAYGDIVWQGAYVFDISPQELKVRGMITHNEEKNEYGYYDWNSQIQRSLYMDDVLYTISQTKIKANDLETVDEIESIDLPKIEYNGGPIYYAEGRAV